METLETSRIKQNLYLFNLWIGVFHLCEAAIMWLLGSHLRFVITGTYLNLDETYKVAAPLTRDLFEVRIGNLVALFLIGSALTHIAICLPKIYEWYYANLAKHLNYIRWFEYAVTASVMTIIIAMLAGIYDFSSLVLLFAVSAAVMIAGYVVEVFEKYDHPQAMKVFWASCLLGAVPWGIIFLYIQGARNSTVQSVDNYVYIIVFSLISIFCLFPLNDYLALKKIGPWKNYYFVETCYMVLSWVAKSALAWQIFLGTRV